MRSTVCAPIVAALLLVTLTLLAGCDLPYFSDFQQMYSFTEARELRKGWIVGEEIPPEPVYCYRTLAEPDCYRAAEPQREHSRLIGMFGPVAY